MAVDDYIILPLAAPTPLSWAYRGQKKCIKTFGQDSHKGASTYSQVLADQVAQLPRRVRVPDSHIARRHIKLCVVPVEELHFRETHPRRAAPVGQDFHGHVDGIFDLFCFRSRFVLSEEKSNAKGWKYNRWNPALPLNDKVFNCSVPGFPPLYHEDKKSTHYRWLSWRLNELMFVRHFKHSY